MDLNLTEPVSQKKIARPTNPINVYLIKKKNMKPTTQDVNGTSFHHTTIKCSVSTLKKVLGKPYDESNTGKNKVNFEWILETDSGDVFTVYDWKEYRSLNKNEMIEWHIGGYNQSATEQAKREIREAIAKN